MFLIPQNHVSSKQNISHCKSIQCINFENIKKLLHQSSPQKLKFNVNYGA